MFVYLKSSKIFFVFLVSFLILGCNWAPIVPFPSTFLGIKVKSLKIPSLSIFIEIERNGDLKKIILKPKNVDGKGTIGAQLQPNIRKETKRTKNVYELFEYTNKEFSSLLVKTIQGYKGLVTNFSSTAQQLSGPVKIVEIGAQLSEQGGSGILLFAALISINLAVLNSLPLPLLDGGQLLFTLIEGFRGKPVPLKLQIAVTQSSFFLLVGLSVLLIIRDTSQLLIVQRLLNQ